MRFPPDWPEECPPIDAITPNGEFFRAIPEEIAKNEHFFNAVEENKYRTAPQCKRLALSLLKTWESAMHHLQLFQHRKDWFVATIRLNEEHGKIQHSPSASQPEHASWWPYDGIDRTTVVVNVKRP